MTKTPSSSLVIVNHPLIEAKLTILRDATTPPPQFRRTLYETSFLLAFPVMAHLRLEPVHINTPLEPMVAQRLADPPPCLVSILRAGNGLIDGFSHVCPEASIGHLGLYRDHETTRPISYYTSLPHDIGARHVILGDPMLATGGSAIMAVEKLHEYGVGDIVYACLVAAPEGVAALHGRFPDLKIFTAALDRELNDKCYILPGLGDAGDRIYGTD